MDELKLLVHEPVLGKFPQKDGGGTITYHYSSDQHLKATAVVLADQQEPSLIELINRPGDE